MAGRKSYKKAAENAVRVGQPLGERLIREIIVVRLEQGRSLIHAVGNGYGAHLVGNAARKSGGLIGRITGLDPERAWFQKWNNKRKMLKKEDATLVDIIHSNGGKWGSIISGKSGFIGVVIFQNIYLEIHDASIFGIDNLT